MKLDLSISELLSPKNVALTNFYRKNEIILTLRIPDKWRKKSAKGTVNILIPLAKEGLSVSKIVSFLQNLAQI